MPERDRTDKRFGYGDTGCFCSRCCGGHGSDTCGALAHNHAVLYIDTGMGFEWLCNVCFDKWIDSLIAQQPITLLPSHPVLVDGDTLTIDGISFEF